MLNNKLWTCMRTNNSCSRADITGHCDLTTCQFEPQQVYPTDDKRQWYLFTPLWETIEEVLKTFERGKQTHDEFGWMNLSDLKEKKLDSLTRHLIAYRKNIQLDEDGLSHMAHVAANALMVLWAEMKDIKGETNVHNKK